MENRLSYPAYLSRHTSIAVSRQDGVKLCKPVRLSESTRTERPAVQLSVSKYAINLLTFHAIATNNRTVVYCGYFFGQYPCGWLIGRFPAQRVLGVSCMFWAFLVIIMTQCRTFSSACEYTIYLLHSEYMTNMLFVSGSKM